MKFKTDFVTNSSSTAFIIQNTSNMFLTLVDFVKENPDLIEEFKEMYGYINNERFTQKNLIKSAEDNNIYFDANSDKLCVFGDEQGTLIGHVFDYILRDGGNSDHFKWWFDHYER